MQTTTTKQALKNDIDKLWSDLETLRDQIRVDLHLAGMEAKDSFSKLDDEIARLPRSVDEATEATNAALKRALERLKAFRKSLG